MGEGLRNTNVHFRTFQFVANLPQTERCFRVSIIGFAEYRLERDIVVEVVGGGRTKVVHAATGTATA